MGYSLVMEDYAPAGTAVPAVPGFGLGRFLGRGGSASVWLVTEQASGRSFALKCFEARDRTATEARAAEEELRREVRILSALKHEHLVRAHAVVPVHWLGPASEGGAEGLGLVLDYAPGGSLAALTAARGRLAAGEAVTVVTPIAQALAYLHGQGFTHGDVAPGNVLFTAHGKPLLADLGVARMVADGVPAAADGTDGFRDPAPVDAVRAGLQPERDVYALAALGWYCLTGRVPEPGERRPPLPLLVPDVPADLAAALEAGLQQDRRLRPTAAELAGSFYRSARAEPVDLSLSVHQTVLPALLTRRAVPQGPAGRWTERLQDWFRRIRRNRPGVEPAGDAATGQAAARHSAGAHAGNRRSGNFPIRRPFRGGSGRSSSGRGGWSRRSSSGRTRRGLFTVSAVLALLLVLAGAWLLGGPLLPSLLPPGSTAGGSPAAGSVLPQQTGPDARAPSAQPETVSIPQDVQALLRSENPAEAVRGLARLRSLALNSGDFSLLDEVNAPGSPAAAADGRIGARLAQSGHVLTGFTTELTAVERVPEAGPLRTVFGVSVAGSPYQERDAAGAIVAEAGADAEQRLRLVLVPVEGRWRISEILPGAPGPG